ncbi:MAG TPA: outer membrane beta-barrel protein [Vicinamibacterales bacterium]|nr:outer membrane beta-barrel protein [Vicinamibacterales bacterium]
MSVFRGSSTAIWVAVLCLMSARQAAAQVSPILPSTRVVLLGPLSLYPQIALRDAGTDSNVYNDSNAPKSDLTYSVTPRLYAVLPIGNTRFVGTGVGDLVYYRTYKDQRSLTTMLEGRYEVTGPGFRPFASVGFTGRGDRQGFEIDQRVRNSQTTLSVGADIDLTARTALTAWARRSKTAYDRNEQYLSVSLADQLDHKSDAVAGGARFRVTPLTSVVITAEVERDRFERAPVRNTDSLRVGPAVEFDSGAAISGDAKAGIRSFVPRDRALARYRGFTGSARLHYTLLSVTRFDVEANRDVAYSYDPIQPYYLESGGRLTVAQRLLGPMEIIGIGERREIRNQRIGGTSFDGRREVTTSLGGGIGFQIQKQMRFALTYERTARTSSEPVGRNYERRRVLASVNYGL